jgi:hypothetical protein
METLLSQEWRGLAKWARETASDVAAGAAAFGLAATDTGGMPVPR